MALEVGGPWTELQLEATVCCCCLSTFLLGFRTKALLDQVRQNSEFFWFRFVTVGFPHAIGFPCTGCAQGRRCQVIVVFFLIYVRYRFVIKFTVYRLYKRWFIITQLLRLWIDFNCSHNFVVQFRLIVLRITIAQFLHLLSLSPDNPVSNCFPRTDAIYSCDRWKRKCMFCVFSKPHLPCGYMFAWIWIHNLMWRFSCRINVCVPDAE